MTEGRDDSARDASSPASIADTMTRAVSLVRAGDYAAALPLLDRVAESGQSPYARMIIGFVRFRLAGHEVASVDHRGRTLRFRIAGDNLGLDMFHVSGALFEVEELEHCREQVPKGGRIVDVGANTGNHSVFFGSFLDPADLLPIEPNAEAVARLKINLALNGIDYDPRGLGVAVAAARGSAALSTGGGDLVVGRLGPGGTIPMLPLDDLVGGPVDFLKIDVEGMEYSVLAGARRILAADRPLLLVETASRMEGRLLAFCAEHRYRIDRTFAGHDYRNYFLTPE